MNDELCTTTVFTVVIAAVKVSSQFVEHMASFQVYLVVPR